MIYRTLPPDANGVVVLPCCGAKLTRPRFPIRCNCQDSTGKPGRGGLVDAIERCEQHGDDLGVFVSCGCASMKLQPVFVCGVHGKAVRYASTGFKGVACIGCDWIRKQANQE